MSRAKEKPEQPQISDLKRSSQRIGKLYPVLLDKNGNIIDGQHRLAADPHWPKMRLDNVSSEKERLLARLVSNVCRRTVSFNEKKEILQQLGRICLEEGERPGKLAHRIADMTGMSYTWVMKYLPEKYKRRVSLRKPSNGMMIDEYPSVIDKTQTTRRVTVDLERLVSTSERKTAVVRTYTNANFVSFTLDKSLYEKFGRVSEKLGTNADIMIGNALITILREIEKIVVSIDCN